VIPESLRLSSFSGAFHFRFDFDCSSRKLDYLELDYLGLDLDYLGPYRHDLDRSCSDLHITDPYHPAYQS